MLKKSFLKRLFACIFFTVVSNSCGEIDGGNLEPMPTVKPTGPPVGPVITNPICTKELTSFGPSNGNLWKPASDTTGNIVLILDSRFKKKFDKCTVELKDGGKAELVCIDNAPWTQIPYSCRANGDRMHLRGDIKAQRVKNKAVILCTEPRQECRFTLLGNATNRYE